MRKIGKSLSVRGLNENGERQLDIGFTDEINRYYSFYLFKAQGYAGFIVRQDV